MFMKRIMSTSTHTATNIIMKDDRYLVLIGFELSSQILLGRHATLRCYSYAPVIIQGRVCFYLAVHYNVANDPTIYPKFRAVFSRREN